MATRGSAYSFNLRDTIQALREAMAANKELADRQAAASKELTDTKYAELDRRLEKLEATVDDVKTKVDSVHTAWKTAIWVASALSAVLTFLGTFFFGKAS